MDNIDYAPLIQRNPPEDLTEFVLKQGGFPNEYLIYRAGWAYDPLEDRKVQAVEVTCTACGYKFYAEKVDAAGCARSWAPAPLGWHHPTMTEDVISGSSAICPHCGHGAEVIHVGAINGNIDTYQYTTQAIRLDVDGQTPRFALLEWQTARYIDKNGRKSYHSRPWTAWVVEEKKIVRLRGWYKYFSTLVMLDQLEQKKTFLDDYNKSELVYPWDPAILIGTTAENCKLDRFIEQGGQSLVAYLAVWRRKGQVENLIMQGCGNLVEELIERDQTVGTYQRRRGVPALRSIDWKQKKPHAMLRISKAEFKAVRTWLDAEDLDNLAALRKAGVEVDIPTQLKLLRKINSYARDMMLEHSTEVSFWKMHQYLSGQSWDVTLLRDYWRMADALQMDLDNLQVRWPKNLKKAHDDAAKRYKSHKSEIVAAGFVRRAEEMKGFEWHQGGLMIRVCQSQQEMIDEGKKLNHCVARYAEDHANGKTTIFLIRKEEQPDVPWFTLELNVKKGVVAQNRGKCNCSRTEEVIEFENNWIAWLYKTKKLGKEAKAA